LKPKKIFAVSIVLAMSSAFIISGCSSGNVEVKIKHEQTNDNRGADGYTPLERGKVRRQIITDTQKALDIWIKGDISAYDQAFTESLLKEYKTQLAKLSKENTEKIRVHVKTSLEVTQLAKNEAGLKYAFTDGSYFINARTKNVMTPPSNKASEIDIVVKKEGAHWKIKAMLGNGKQTL
jgi:hypothetical protein